MDKLLDFEYTDEDITSLRLQMRLPVSQVSISTQGIATPGELTHKATGSIDCVQQLTHP